MWKIYLIENYLEEKDDDGTNARYSASAVIVKIHHSYTDGIGLSSMFLHIFECESEQPDKLFINLKKPNKIIVILKVMVSFFLIFKIYYDYSIKLKTDNNRFFFFIK